MSDFAGALEYIARSRAQNFAYVSQGCSAQQPLCSLPRGAPGQQAIRPLLRLGDPGAGQNPFPPHLRHPPSGSELR